MHSIAFLQDLAVVMVTAGVVTVIFHQFKQPVVLGYILAGFIIGPHSPPFSLITSDESINTLAEIGILLLMFSLGLEFSLRKLKQVGGTAVIAAVLEILGMGWVGYELAGFFGWKLTDRVFLAAMLAMSSTTIIIKVLGDLRQTRERYAQLVFGILIIEDVLGIAMLALLSGIAMTGTLSMGAVGATLGKLGVFLAVSLVAGLILVPRLLGYVARFKSNEMLLVTVLGLCFGVSMLAAKLGYSEALGAFVIGAMIAEARELHRIATLVEPVRDMFSAVFFVAIGLLIDPRMLAVHWWPILAITLAVIICKVVACASGAFLAGNDSRTSLRVGMSVAQIGEFSFIIASLGLTLKVTSDFLYPIAVAVSSITTLLTPYFIRSSDGVMRLIKRVTPPALASFLQVYTRWVGRISSQRHSDLAAKLTRRWLAQVALNAALMTGVFIAAVYLGQNPPAWLKKYEFSKAGTDTLLWVAAVVVSMPMFIAAARKLQALGLLVAQTRVTKHTAGDHAPVIQAVISRVIPIAGSALLGVYILVLTSALLPPFRVMLMLLALLGLVAWLLRRSFIRVYSKAQIALVETFAQPPPALHQPEMPALLREAALETIIIDALSPGAGKLISELRLRTLTGASIIGIQRSGAPIVNPEPDEEIRPGDELLLLGMPPQIAAARTLLAPPPSLPGTAPALE